MNVSVITYRLHSLFSTFSLNRGTQRFFSEEHLFNET